MELFKAVRYFYKKATLLQDVANRIMYELGSDETFDFVKARWVAKGAEKVIHYSTMAMLDEMQHYNVGGPYNFLYQQTRPLNKTPIEVIKNIDKYRDFCERMKKYFYDVDNWDSAFGGVAWGKIADTTIKIINAYEDALTSTSYSDDEEKALKETIIYLNVFDGLAHNTSAVFPKLLSNQSRLLALPFNESREHGSQFRRMRDVSEIPDRIKVYKEIKDKIHPRHVFKKDIEKIIRDPEYFNKNVTDEELQEVADRKESKATCGFFINSFEGKKIKIENRIFKPIERYVSTIDPNTIDLGSDTDKITNTFSNYMYLIESIDHSLGWFMGWLETRATKEPLNSRIDKKINEIHEQCKYIREQYHDIDNSLSGWQISKSKLIELANKFPGLMEKQDLLLKDIGMLKDML